MKRILICTGVLGGGTALTFGAAMLAASLLPGGRVIPVTNPNIMFGVGGQMKGGPVPVPWQASGTSLGPDVVVALPAESPSP